MAKSNTKHRVCSRQSSVSSLLSCSLSGSNSSNSGSFRYKDKLYSSASQALQAYIDDFDLSQMCLGASNEKINIDKCSTNMPEFSSNICKPNNGMLLSFVFFLPIDIKHFERCIVVLEN